MDIFIEEMIEKKNSINNVLMVFGLMVLAVVATFILMFVLMPMLPAQLGFFTPFLVVAIFYGAYKFAVAQNVEFEYSLVNNEIDIDKIVNCRSRKKLTVANIRGLEAFGYVCDAQDEYKKYISDASVEKVFACRNKRTEDNYFIVYFQGSEKMLLVFNPSDKIIAVIEKFNPKRV